MNSSRRGLVNPRKSTLTIWGRRLAVVVAMAALAIAPSACGSSSGGGTTTTTAPNGY
jgi:hypothetical protein